MKILLKGYYGFGNFGDDLLMLISYRILKEKYPGSIITIFSNNTENLKEFKSKPNYNNYIFKILGNEVPLIDWTIKEHFDLIVEGGGGTYFDNTSASLLYYLRNLLVGSISTKLLRKTDGYLRLLLGRKKKLTCDKRVALGIGIGPFHNSSKLFYAKMVDLSSIDFLMVRDAISYLFAKKLNPTNPIKQGGDLAFLTKHWRKSAINTPSENTTKTIGFILMGDDKKFKSKIHSTAKAFLSKGWKVSFFAFDENIDQCFIHECQKYFNVGVWTPEKTLLTDYIEKLKKCSVLITERAHGAIIGAIIGCVPYFVSKSYKVNQILSFFKNTINQFSMNLDHEIDSPAIDKIWEEMNQRKKLLKLDTEQNLDHVVNSISFAFR